MLKSTLMQGLLSAAVAATFAIPVASHAQAPSATMTTPAASGLSKADQKIVVDMAHANMAEVEAGKLALSKTQNAEVKAFAQLMVDDHTKALNDVTQLAQNKGVTLPTELDSKHKAMADKLSKLSGDAFDKEYMAKAGVADHKAVHAALKKNEARAKDPDVKALAAKMLPTVEQHLHSATGMAGMKGGAKGVKPPVTGEANDHTSPGAVAQATPKAKPMTGTTKPVPVGEANDHTSPNAVKQAPPKPKPATSAATSPNATPPVVGEASEAAAAAGVKR